ncbi:MAG: hypothetical protein RBU37_13735 [Myxococcota bacterium]|jgi:DNA repair exonuclease SbcCD ATPase subunit|nr:hypothetical protein [Myxococcota bacterium]
MEVVIIILAIVLIAVVAMWIAAQKKVNNYLDTYEKLDKEVKEAKEQNAALKQKLAASKGKEAATPVAAEKKAAKPKKKEDSAEYVEMKKAKEENYRLKQDLKELRKELRDSEGASGETQRAIMEAKEDVERYKREAEEAQNRLKMIEQEHARIAEEEGEVQVAAPKTESPAAAPANTEELDRLRKKLERVQGDYSELKANFRAEVDAARKEAAANVNLAKKDLRNTKRQLATYSKRAENNHKVFLITRSQLMLVEQRLAQLDAKFKPSVPVDASNAGIEDAVNMAVTRDAREAKQREDAAKMAARLSRLEAALREYGVDPDALTAPAEEAPVAESPAPAPEPKDEKPKKGKKGKERRDKAEADEESAETEATPAKGDAEVLASGELDAAWDAVDPEIG